MLVLKWITPSSVKLAAIRGASQPGMVPKPFVIPKMVPGTKIGDITNIIKDMWLFPHKFFLYKFGY